MIKHILIPTDGSALAARAARAAVDLARTTGARVTGLFVAPSPTPVVYRRWIPVDYMTPQQHAAMIERTASRCLGVIERAAAKAGVRCDTLRVEGEFPAEAIVETARRRRCDLIFMASHGQRGIVGALLGSETQKVLSHSPVPVLVHK